MVIMPKRKQRDQDKWDQIEEGLEKGGKDSNIGVGSFGTVSKQRYWGTPVAVKELLSGDDDFSEEIQVLSELRHPNVVSMLAHTDKKIIMELYDGSLDRIKSYKEMAFVAINCMRALCYMQSNSKCTFHGDIKPDNILVNRDQNGNIVRVALGDVGLARSCKPFDSFNGSPGYMPHPHKGELNSLSDTHALAVSLLDSYFHDEEVHAYFPEDDDELGLDDNVARFIAKTPDSVQNVMHHMIHAYKDENLNNNRFNRDLYLRTIILPKWESIVEEFGSERKLTEGTTYDFLNKLYK